MFWAPSEADAGYEMHQANRARVNISTHYNARMQGQRVRAVLVQDLAAVTLELF